MTGQNDAAAERSAHERDPDAGQCFVCGGPWKGGTSYAARVLPPLVQVCSATCAADPKFSAPPGALRPNGAVECPPVSDTGAGEASEIK